MGIAFMRPVSQRIYGIPPEQVVGSSVVTEFQVKEPEPEVAPTVDENPVKE